MCVAKLLKKYPDIDIDGCDISSKSLKIAKQKKLYRSLFRKIFEKKINITKKYDSVSMIGSMTYCKNPKKLFSLIINYLKKNGVFIFTHRIDLWEKENFDSILNHFNKSINNYDKALKFITDPKRMLISEKLPFSQNDLPTIISSWSNHYN